MSNNGIQIIFDPDHNSVKLVPNLGRAGASFAFQLVRDKMLDCFEALTEMGKKGKIQRRRIDRIKAEAFDDLAQMLHVERESIPEERLIK